MRCHLEEIESAAKLAIPGFQRVVESQSWAVISSQDPSNAPKLVINGQDVVSDGHGVVEDVVADFFDRLCQAERIDTSAAPIIRSTMRSYNDETIFTTRIRVAEEVIHQILPRAAQCQASVKDHETLRQCKNKTTHVANGKVLCWRHRLSQDS